MSNLNSISIFKHEISADYDVTDLISELNELREKVNKTFYSNLNKASRKKLLLFLWTDLNNLWTNGNLQVKLSASSAIGHILVFLAPYFAEELINSLISTIRTFNSPSLLLVSCFNYLTKFFKQNFVEKFVVDLRLIPLISIKEAENIPKLVRELLHLPEEFLCSLASYFMGLLVDNPDNKYIAESAQIIVSKNPQQFSFIVSEDTPLQIFSYIFGAKFPNFSNNIVEHFETLSLSIIQEFNPDVSLYSAACRVLSAFIASEQVPFDIVHGIFTCESIKKSPSIKDLLLLPIETDIVYSLYGNQKFTLKNIVMDSTGFFDNDNNLSYNSDFNPGSDEQSDLNSGNSTIGAIRPMKSVAFLPSLPLPDMPIMKKDIKANLNDKPVENSNANSKEMKPSALESSIISSQELTPMNFSSPLTFPEDDNKKAIIDINSSNIPTGLTTITDELELPEIPTAENFQVRPKSISFGKTVKIVDCFSSNVTSNNSDSFLPVPTPSSSNKCKVTPRKTNSKPTTIENYAEFISSQSNIDILRVDQSFVIPLMEYFKRFPQYQNELCNLVLHCLSENNDETLITALSTVADFLQYFEPLYLNCILYEILNLKTNDYNIKMKILEILGGVEIENLGRMVADKIIFFIDSTSTSKIDALRHAAKKAFVRLYQHTSLGLFKFIFDIFVQKTDIFNQDLFEKRLSFIAYIFKKVPGNWYLSFIHIISYVTEALSIFTFNRRVMLDVFSIIAVFSPHISDPSIFIIPIQHAINVLENTYKDYTGKTLFTSKSPFFENSLPPINTRGRFESDLISNPGIWHTSLIKCGQAAFSLIANIPWKELKSITNEDIQFLQKLVKPLAPLFPKEYTKFVISLCSLYTLDSKKLNELIKLAIDNSYRSKEIICTVQLIVALSDQIVGLNFNDFILTVSSMLRQFKDLDYLQVQSLKQFTILYNIKTDPEIFNLMANSKSKAHSDSSEEPSAQDNEIMTEEDETDKNIAANFKDNRLNSLIVSITPLIYANLDVDPSILSANKVISFCANSKSKIDEDQCKELFRHCLNNLGPRALFFVLRYAQKNKFKLDIINHLDHPCIRSRRLFLTVMNNLIYGKKGFSDLPSQTYQYIKSFIQKDLVDYVLDIQPQERKIATNLLRFDPKYFISRWIEMDHFHSEQLYNICMYSGTVHLPVNEFLSFAFHIIKMFENSRKKRNLARRILAVAVIYNDIKSNINEENKEKFLNLIKIDLIPKADTSAKSKKHLVAADYVEFGYIAIVSHNLFDCSNFINFILNVLTKSAPLTRSIQRLNKKTNHNDIVLHDKQMLPSILFSNISLVTEIMKNDPKYCPPNDIINNICQIPYVKTATTDDLFCRFIFILINKNMHTLALKNLGTSLFKSVICDVSSVSLIKYLANFKLYATGVSSKNQNLQLILENLSILFTTSILPANFIDVYSYIAIKIGKIKVFTRLMSNHLMIYNSYFSYNYAEASSIIFMQCANDLSDVIYILPVIPNFYILFNAVVAIEKRNRSTTHDSLTKKFRGAHRQALEMLKDDKYRIFAPYLALLPDKTKVPAALKRLFDGVNDKIQRIYMTDTYHEF